jgi:hypothetical protein
LPQRQALPVVHLPYDPQVVAEEPLQQDVPQALAQVQLLQAM